MIKHGAGIFLFFACLAFTAPLANAQSEIEKSKKQVCLEKCDHERLAECNFDVRLSMFTTKEQKAAAIKNCDKQLSTCRGKCGSYEGTRVIRR